MKRKTYGVFVLLMVFFCAAVGSILRVSGGAEYVAAAQKQSLYELKIGTARGMIYDKDLNPLLEEQKRTVAAVAPTIEAIGALEKATGGKYRERLKSALESGKPFLMELEEPISHPCIDLFSVSGRYRKDQLAPHVIGYVDSLGAGVSGVELAMNDVLEEYGGRASVYYQVDALGRVVAGGEREVVDTLSDLSGGVALTLDSELQREAEAAAKLLKKGAVVVTEAPNCEIRALASVPTYSPADLGNVTSQKDGPLVNRAFCAYAPGSVFKLVGTACALESGLETKQFTCTGSVNAGGLTFHCIDNTAHGPLNLRGALMQSCNCYFINCARSLGGQSMLSMAYNLGLGAQQEFGRGLFTAGGTLSDAETLENMRALANFSFGQGETEVTPVQLCGLLNAIVSNGVYSTPKLIAGTVGKELELFPNQPVTEKSVQVMSESTAGTLQSYLESTVQEGTAKAGKPDGMIAGAKTGTAQTGVYEKGEELLHFWYCGYVKLDGGPTYCITVLAESTPNDHGAAAQVFRRVAESLSK